MNDQTNLYENLKKQVEVATWDALSTHHERGAVYIVDADVDIVEAGVALAEDHVSLVKEYLDKGLLYPPLKEEVTLWAESNNYEFNFLIIQPYVLIQRKTT